MHEHPPSKEAAAAALDTRTNGQKYAIIDDEWLIDTDGMAWPYLPKGSFRIEGDFRSGVRGHPAVIVWTGRWRKLKDGNVERFAPATIEISLEPNVGRDLTWHCQVRGYRSPVESDGLNPGKIEISRLQPGMPMAEQAAKMAEAGLAAAEAAVKAAEKKRGTTRGRKKRTAVRELRTSNRGRRASSDG